MKVVRKINKKHWERLSNLVTVMMIFVILWTMYNNYQYKKLNLLYEQQIEQRELINEEYKQAVERITEINKGSAELNEKIEKDINDLRSRVLHRLGLEE